MSDLVLIILVPTIWGFVFGVIVGMIIKSRSKKE